MVEFVCGSLFVRVMGGEDGTVKPGEMVGGHTHHFDHMSFFIAGTWHVRKWNPAGELVHNFERTAPFFLHIEAEARHAFTYLDSNTEPGRAWCLYSHRTPQGDVSLVETGWYQAFEATSPPPWEDGAST
jgi:hypothetical protein